MTAQLCSACAFSNAPGAPVCARCGGVLPREPARDASRPTEADVARRMRERTMSERKRRIWRNALVFVVVTIGMLYVALLERDRQAVRNSTDLGRRLAAALQLDLEHNNRLPVRVPDLGERYRLAISNFMANSMYTSQYPTVDPVAVMYSKQPVALYFRPPGRVVVLLEQKSFRSEWLDETVFRERRADLGLGVGAD